MRPRGSPPPAVEQESPGGMSTIAGPRRPAKAGRARTAGTASPTSFRRSKFHRLGPGGAQQHLPRMPSSPRTIVEADALTDEQRRHLFYFEDDVFGLVSHGLTWAPKERFFTVHIDGRLVGNAGVVARAVSVGGRAVRVAGLGSVVTRPEARGAGHASAAVAAAMRYGREALGAEFGMLFCLPRLVAFYRRLGWEPVAAPVTIEQPAGRVASPLAVMIKPLGQVTWPAGPVDVNGKPW